jgi:hypothetical protein
MRIYDRIIPALIIFFSVLLQIQLITTNSIDNPDEYIYLARAWSVLNFSNNDLTIREVFAQEHPPLGWILLALFAKFFPGLPWTIKGRLFIALCYVIEKCLVYLIAEKYYSKQTGLISLLLFAGSSTIISYHYLVYLDNIGIIFILFGIYIIGKEKVTIQDNYHQDIRMININANSTTPIRFYGSALSFGLAFLCKFPLILFIPGLVYFYFYQTHFPFNFLTREKIVTQMKFWFKWFIIFVIPFLIFLFLFSYYRSLNIFIDGLFLIGTRRPIYGNNSDYPYFLLYWMTNQSPALTIMTHFLAPICFLIAIGFFLVDLKKSNQTKGINKKYHIPSQANPFFQQFLRSVCNISGFIFMYMIIIWRGHPLAYYYIIPIIPFGCLLIGILIEFQIRYLVHKVKEFCSRKKISSKKTSIFITGGVGVNLLLLGGLLFYPYNYTLILTPIQPDSQQTLNWVIENLNKDAIIVVDNFFIAELRDAGFKYVQLFVYTELSDFRYNLSNIDYLIMPSLNVLIGTNLEPLIMQVSVLQTFTYYSIFEVIK